MNQGRALLALLALRRRVRGARVVCVGGDSGASGLLREWGAARVWALPGPWPEARRSAVAALEGEGADWIVATEAEGLDVVEMAGLLAPGGRAIVGLHAEDDAALAASYRRLLPELRAAFPSVQLLVHQRSVLDVLAPLDPSGGPEVLGGWEGRPEVEGYLFVCGHEALALGGALLVPRPLPEDRPQVTAPGGEERELERLRRRCGDAIERAELAELRAEEAEARWSDAERRADRAEAERAELAVALRRLEHELEMALRNQEALAGTLAERRSTSG